jgi:hypothetical protein
VSTVHYVVSDCVVRAMAAGHPVRCARSSIAEVTCGDCLEEIERWQQRWLDRNVQALQLQLYELRRMVAEEGARLAQLEAQVAEQTSAATRPTCPSCASELELRINRSSGASFWGCSNYPRCRYSCSATTPRTAHKETPR